jgi:hypothetical protein
MLTRPAAASLDMLSAKEVGVGTWFVEFLYLFFLVALYAGLLYYLFHRLEKSWNDIRSA